MSVSAVKEGSSLIGERVHVLASSRQSRTVEGTVVSVLRSDIENPKGGLIVRRENSGRAFCSWQGENLVGTLASADRCKIALPDERGIGLQAHFSQGPAISFVTFLYAEKFCRAENMSNSPVSQVE